jgi:GntR family transcriptional regulator
LRRSRLSPLPSEEALAKQFGVTQPTGRQGLTELRASGLVEVIMGRGTFARSPHSRPSVTRPRGVRRGRDGAFTEADCFKWTDAEEPIATRTDAPLALADLLRIPPGDTNSLSPSTCAPGAPPRPSPGPRLPEGVPVLHILRVTLDAQDKPLALEEFRLPGDNVELAYPCPDAEHGSNFLYSIKAPDVAAGPPGARPAPGRAVAPVSAPLGTARAARARGGLADGMR